MIRRSFLKHLAALPLFATATSPAMGTSAGKLKIMIKSAWGSDDPTKAAFRFLHGDALSEAGHEVQIFVLGEAVSLMRKPVASAVVPVGWPPVSEALSKIDAKKIPIYACGACSRARGVTEADLNEYGAKFGNPKSSSRSWNGQTKSSRNSAQLVSILRAQPAMHVVFG
jgi:predicted peroxiredoxin